MTPDELVLLMKDQNWSVKELAKKTGVHHRQIYRYRSGENAIPEVFVNAIKLATSRVPEHRRRKKKVTKPWSEQKPRAVKPPMFG